MQELQQRPWPKLREDLTLHAGPTTPEGAPTWTLHDPARNQYFSIDWVAFEIISRLYLGSVESICESIHNTTLLQIDQTDVPTVLDFLEQNELVQRHGLNESAFFTNKHSSRQTTLFNKILHGYLFFRVPLWKPDAWLARFLPHIEFLFQPFFLKLTTVALLLGLWGVFRQWSTFQSTLVDTFSLDGLIGYGGALIAIKILHEFGHAFVAKRCGCKVPAMGVAFLVMWPMAYTDVTESWKLGSHKKRLMIAGAGIATELVAAAWMLLFWVLLPDGHLRGVAFFLATTSIVATLAINASPLMRFDGYFLLCDILGQPNLHARSFAYARWWLREQLFRLQEPPPEELSRGWHQFFIAFAFGTWLYRLIVFFGIALLVYHYFFKALGVLLFLVEIAYFILFPILSELQAWYKRWDKIGPVVRHRPAFYVMLAGLGILLIPYDVTVNSQGMLKPERSFSVVAHQPSRVDQLPPARGSLVELGQQLISLSSPELEQKLQKSRIKVEALERQFGSVGFNNETIRQQSVLKEQLNSAREELNGLIAEKGRLNPLAPFTGVIADVEPDLFNGEWVPKGMELVRLIDDHNWIVDTYIEESDLRRLDDGNWGWFVPEAAGLPDSWLSVVSIDRDASRTLGDAALSSTTGGQVLARVQNNKFYPEHAVYRVRLKANFLGEKISTGHLRGRVVILAWPKSIAGDLIRGALTTFVREAGF